jgi:hypothetical protein
LTLATPIAKLEEDVAVRSARAGVVPRAREPAVPEVRAPVVAMEGAALVSPMDAVEGGGWGGRRVG